MSMARLRRPAGRDGPVRVLLLHGLGGRPGAWDRFAEHTTGPLELWDVELPWHGMGGSEWSHPRGSGGGDPVNVLVELVARGAAGEPFDALVAHSYSANLLVEALTAGLVAPRPAVLVSPFYRPSPLDFDWPAISYYLNEFHLTFVEALRVGETARFPDSHRTWMAMRLRDQIGPYGWMRFFETYLRSPFLDLGAVTTPVLVLTGDTDVAARPDDGRAIAAALPFGRFTLVEGCGHFPMMERPGRTAQLVSEFLSLAASPETASPETASPETASPEKSHAHAWS